MGGQLFIGFTGQMGSGKSTCAVILKSILIGKGYTDRDIQILPFAYPLKSYATMLGWDGKKDERGRRLLQLLGTECGRNCIDIDLWVKLWKNNINPIAKIIIADDVRFDNEADAIRENGIIVHVHRTNCENSNHASEAGILDVKGDSHILNDGTVEVLYYLIEPLYKHLVSIGVDDV